MASMGKTYERLLFFVVILLLAIHLAACFWLTAASFKSDQSLGDLSETPTDSKNAKNPQELYKGTWVSKFLTKDNDELNLYVVAVYWAVQTVTTVGYGDVSTMNSTERLLCSLMMLTGVVAFSFADGAFMSIILNNDQQMMEFKENMLTLEKLYEEYKLPLDLYIRIKKFISYSKDTGFTELQSFLDDLPVKLKTEVSLYVFEQRYQSILFFEQKEVQFIVWMCQLLKP